DRPMSPVSRSARDVWLKFGEGPYGMTFRQLLEHVQRVGRHQRFCGVIGFSPQLLRLLDLVGQGVDPFDQSLLLVQWRERDLVRQYVPRSNCRVVRRALCGYLLVEAWSTDEV